MARIAHGEVVTPEQVQEAEKELASSGDAGLASQRLDRKICGPSASCLAICNTMRLTLLLRSKDTLKHLKALAGRWRSPMPALQGIAIFPDLHLFWPVR